MCGVPQGSVLVPLLLTLHTTDIGGLIRSFGLNHHSYADDNQVYSSCHPGECTVLKDKILECTDAIGKCIASNQMMPSTIRNQSLWCATSRWVLLIDRSTFRLKDGTVEISCVVRNLGAFFVESMSMSDDVNRLIRTFFYQLRRLKCFRRSPPTSTAIQLINLFIISRVDYCNSMPGLPKYQLDHAQSILNVAARLIFGRGRHDQVTPLQRDRLHWLRVPQRIDLKSNLLVHKKH